MTGSEIVSVAILTEVQSRRLGAGFTRHIPNPPNDDMFADLIRQLAEVDTRPAQPTA